MTDKLSCAIVRDLLPSYVEGLTEEKTNRAVAAHLAQCADCARRYQAMTAPGDGVHTEEAREVDYLKAVRRRNRNKVILAVAAVLLLVTLGLAAKLFLIGSPARMIYGRPVLHSETNTLELNIMNPNSGTGYRDWKQSAENGVVTVTAREVLTGFGAVGDRSLSIGLDGVNEVWVFDQLIWKDGLFIDDQAVSLFREKQPYVGNAPGLGQLGELLELYQFFPPLLRTYELQTQSEPYRWTIVYDSDPHNWNSRLEQYGPLALALVDNLGEFAWCWPGEEPHVLTLEEADAALPGLVEAYNLAHGTDWTPKDSVKDYGASAFDLQQLMELLGSDFTAAHTVP